MKPLILVLALVLVIIFISPTSQNDWEIGHGWQLPPSQANSSFFKLNGIWGVTLTQET
ncbi:MAG: hypothetical protein ACE5GI_02235 [Candidatus Aminicenantales bacterium]